MAKKISLADQAYDRLCEDYVLKARPHEGFTTVNKGLNTYKTTSYQIEGVGVVSIFRCSGLFGTGRESMLFTPVQKDAPLFFMDHERNFGSESLTITFLDAALEHQRYMQFMRLEDDFGKLKNVQGDDSWAGSHAIAGSVTKSGSNEELSAMLDTYLNAYLRVVECAPACDETRKKEKLKELAEAFLANNQRNMADFRKVLGGRTEEVVKSTLFGL